MPLLAPVTTATGLLLIESDLTGADRAPRIAPSPEATVTARMAAALDDPLDLPCGLTIANRLGRAAMTEGISGPRNDPNERHFRLYEANAHGGAGLILTGNAMVDRRHLERARNVVVDGSTDPEALRRWAENASAAPTLVQLSHPGRQANRVAQPRPVSASDGPAVALGGAFAKPRGLTSDEVAEVRARFVDAAVRVTEAGFPGVQLHAAHGYLLNQFLDPEINRRRDAHGGDLAGRARLLLEIVGDLRAALPGTAAVAVKIDGRDDREAELIELGRRLEEAGIDLIEVSGGNYERPMMVGYEGNGELVASEHESPFWEAAAAVTAAVEVPVMLTGGFRTRAEVDRALAGGVCDLVGAGRPLAVRPDLAGRFVRGETDTLERPGPRLGGPMPIRKLLGAASGTGWHRIQIARTSDGKEPMLDLPALPAGIDYMLKDMAQAAISYRSRMGLAERTPAPRVHS